MSLSEDIMELLRDDGYQINEAVEDAIKDFVQVVEEEADNLTEVLEEADEE